jgi:hypothetical protein
MTRKPIWIGKEYFESHYVAAKALPNILGRKLIYASALQYIRIAVANSEREENRVRLLGGVWVSETEPEPPV